MTTNEPTITLTVAEYAALHQRLGLAEGALRGLGIRLRNLAKQRDPIIESAGVVYAMASDAERVADEIGEN